MLFPKKPFRNCSKSRSMIPSETKRLLNFRTRTQADQRMLYKTNRKTRLRKECALSSQGGKVCLCDSNFLIAGNTNLLIIFRLREVLIYGKLDRFSLFCFLMTGCVKHSISFDDN